MWDELLKNMKRIIDSQERILGLLVSHEEWLNSLESGQGEFELICRTRL